MIILRRAFALILSCFGAVVLLGVIPGIGKLFSADSTEDLLSGLIAHAVLILLVLCAFKAAGWLWKGKQSPPPLPPGTPTEGG